MTNKEKYNLIDEKIERINKSIFKNFKYKFKFKNNGSGEYCVIFNKKEYRFATLGDVIIFLSLFLDIFSVALSVKNTK